MRRGEGLAGGEGAREREGEREGREWSEAPSSRFKASPEDVERLCRALHRIGPGGGGLDGEEHAARAERDRGDAHIYVRPHFAAPLPLGKQLGDQPDDRLRLVSHQRREASRACEHLEQRGVVEVGGHVRGPEQRREGSLDHRSNPEPAILEALLGDGSHVIAEVTRGALEQDVLLAREVSEERRPAHLGVGDHVLHPSVGDTDLAIAGDGRVVEAVPLVDSPSLGRRGGQRRLAGSAPVSDEGRPVALARI